MHYVKITLHLTFIQKWVLISAFNHDEIAGPRRIITCINIMENHVIQVSVR